uniref:aspartyl protease family protein n=1 Tax=Candidatus Limisoma sp. TaxID=3076476 RepID=UPI004027BCD9
MIKETPVGEIPFAIAGDSRIYVTAFVNGSDSLRFLVDTGASSIVLNTNSPKLKGLIHNGESADNLGASGENSVEYSNDNSVKVGSIQYDNAGCAHIPYPPEYWDGVFGLNGLAAFNIEINYDDFKIYCYPKDTLTVDDSFVSFPFIYKYDVPFVQLPVKLNGKLHNLLLEIDTGSDRIIDLNTPFVNKNRLLDTQKPFAISRIASSDGGSGELKNVFFDEVIVGPYIMPKVAGAFSTLSSGMQSKEDIDGMIGNNFLKRFNILIDFKSNNIYLQPNNFYYTPFYDFLVK